MVCIASALPGLAQAEVIAIPFDRTPDGSTVWVYRILGQGGFEVEVMSYGATLLSVKTPDREGNLENVCLRLDSPADYLRGSPAMGCVVGRFANRIAGARFEIDGVEYKITPNAGGKNHIHGGANGFGKRLWESQVLEDQSGVRFTMRSADGDEGYPGAVVAHATYRVQGGDTLVMAYEATTDKPTHVNLTNHAYWNLAGLGSGDVLGHVIQILADQYLEFDADNIPWGKVLEVAGSPLDFREPRVVGERIQGLPSQNYDHCYVLRGMAGMDPRPIATVSDPESGRRMEVLGTHPGVQFYTAKGLSDRYSHQGKPYGPYHGLCLETQHYPNTPNVPSFPTTLVRPGDTYRQTTIHRFSVRK